MQFVIVNDVFLSHRQKRKIPLKIFLMVKFAAFLLLIACLHAYAGNGQKISINVKNAGPAEVFSQIQKQSDVHFFYNETALKNAVPVTLKLKNQLLSAALEEYFSRQPFTYSIVNNMIVIKERELTVTTEPAYKAIPPPIKITGRVVDTTGAPIAGASVLIKGTQTGTTTKSDGSFSIESAVSSGTIIFSFVGYVAREVKFSNDTYLTITLQALYNQEADVVVVGYGTIRKRDLTGSIVSLTPKDLNTANTVSADQMLQGRAAGIQITQSSQAPGGGVSVRIRGSGSVNAGNEPLYVVDGVPIDNRSIATGNGNVNFTGSLPPTNPLNVLNPNDIASIEILKDASATAIYGSRGANGVILITTKSGKGQFKASYSTQIGVAKIARKMELLSTADYIRIMNDLAVERGLPEVFSSEYEASVGAGTDWQDQIFRSALTQNHNLSLSGGSDKTSYYASFNFTDQDGIVKHSNYQRVLARLNFEQRVSDRFKFGMNVNTSQENNYAVPVNGNGINQQADAINSALNTPPVFPIYNEDGSFYRPENGTPISVTLDNPVAILDGQKAKDKINRTLLNVFAEYKIASGLTARLNVGSDRVNKRRDVYLSRLSQNGASVGGAAGVVSGELSNSLAEGTLSYNRIIRNDHSVNAVAGVTVQQFDERTVNAGTTGFASDVIETNDLGLGTIEFNRIGSYFGRRRLLSYLGRVNYSYKGKYMLTGTIRADGSSNFGINNRFGYFPSFSGAWNIAEEDFIKQSPVLSTLKLRLGWGQIGNDNIGIGTALSTYVGNGSIVFDGALKTAVSPARIPNPNLKWETSQQTNIGLDFGLFSDRITGSVDYFIKTNKDLLFNVPIPISSGFATFTDNIGQISNRGIEFLVTSENLVNELKWKSTFNFTKINNQVDNLGGVDMFLPSDAPVTVLKPGVPLFSYFGYKFEGIFQNQAEIDASAQKNARPGDPRWLDVDDNGVINAQDRVVLGNPYPDITVGLNNDFEYKRFTFSFFWEGVFGVDMFHWQTVDALYANDPYRNRLADPMLNRWTPENPTNHWPSGVSTDQLRYSNTNSLTILDASFIRLKNAQLGYLLPIKNSKVIRSVNLFFSGQNLFLITKYPGFDPDVNSNGTGNVRRDRNAYPAARTFLGGLTLNF